MNRLINNELGNWIRDYSKDNYNEDWKLCVDLTYKYGVKNEKICRKWVGRLKEYLNKNDVIIDGFVVNEYDKNINYLHNHLLCWVDCSWSVGKSLIYNYWNKIGSVNIERYNVNKNYSNYIVKYIGRNYNNDWDFISNI